MPVIAVVHGGLGLLCIHLCTSSCVSATPGGERVVHGILRSSGNFMLRGERRPESRLQRRQWGRWTNLLKNACGRRLCCPEQKLRVRAETLRSVTPYGKSRLASVLSRCVADFALSASRACGPADTACCLSYGERLRISPRERQVQARSYIERRRSASRAKKPSARTTGAASLRPLAWTDGQSLAS
jgi:hypothetical protein